MMKLAFCCLLTLISWLALSPKPPAVGDLGWDKLNHIAAFLALGLAARAAWPNTLWTRWAAGLLGYGVLLELAQGLTPNRHAEAIDVLADALGLLVAFGLTHAWQRWQGRQQAR